MSNKRIIKFYYFRPYIFKNSKKEKPFNFAEWIIKFEKDNRIFETISLDTLTARVDGHTYDKRNDLHGVCFVNMRGENLPSKVTEGKAQEDLDLDDDEYIGEDMYTLYDRSKNIFMVQSNRMSLTINRLAEFINKTKEQDDTTIGFVPITQNVTQKMLQRKRIRSIEVACESIYNKDCLKSSTLKSICDNTSKIGCSTYKFKFGVGKKRHAELSPIESQNIIDDIINRNIDASSAKLAITDQSTGELEYIDLIENKLCSFVEYNFMKRERLHLESFFPKMRDKYIEMKSKNDL